MARHMRVGFALKERFLCQSRDRRLGAINIPGFKTLNEGDRVSFDVEETDRGSKAKNVSKL
ncbi:MAG: cold shock domain-containing protein [Deltaproteobacteria bacterium]|nr:cold shock domain-containing protein [Deltaproteobacteria bacterium]